MSSPTRKPFLSKLIGNVPLRAILIVPFVVQIVAAVGTVGYLSFRSGQKAVNDMAIQIQEEVSDRTKQQVLSYLERPTLTLETIAAAIKTEQLDLNDQIKQQWFFWHLVDRKTVMAVQLITPEGNSVLVERVPNQIETRVRNSTTTPDREVYRLDNRGDRLELIERQKNFDSRTRPWYKNAIAAQKPVWTSLYINVNTSVVAITATYPVYDRAEQLLVVLSSRFDIPRIYDFLKTLEIGKTGQFFIINRDGEMIASSKIEQPYIIKGKDLETIKAFEIENPTIQATAKQLIAKFGNFTAITDTQQINFDINGERYFVQVTPMQDEWGIDWLGVVVLPESDFMAQINANTQTTIFLCIGTLLIATILGWYTSRWVTQPLQRLSQASEAIAAGNLEQNIELSGKNELGRLAQSFNRMAQQLREAFNHLQNTNVELEQRVEARTVELQQAKDMADSANLAKSNFLANMSHELRTPLNGVLGYTQILQRTESLSPKARKGIDIIYQCGSHLLMLINDILDLSKIEADKVELHPTSFHFPSFLQGVAEICNIRAEQKHIAFNFAIDPQLPVGVKADEKRLRQVLINLLGNAIKFTDKGSVTFKVEVIECQSSHPECSINQSIFNQSSMENRSESSIENHQSIFNQCSMENRSESSIENRKSKIENKQNRSVRFQIEDTGVGITPEQLEKIFMPFEQVGNTKKQAEGTGLGLSISQKIVALMNTTIQVQSQAGVGSIFSFEVELPDALDWADTSWVTQQGAIAGYEGKKRKILVVDDRWENRSVLIHLLEPIGFELIEAENGQEGMDRALSEQPDLIVTDLAMPVMDGFEFLQKLRSYPELKEMPVLVSSASVFEIHRHKSLAAGGSDFLPKPIQADILLELIQKYLQLDWIYNENQDSKVNSKGKIAPDQILPPAIEVLQQIRELAKLGDLDGVVEIAQQIQTTNSEHFAFAQELISLAESFQTKPLRAFIQQYID
ncbi:MAG: ATP-binding protein [Tychonema bourrellyi B0820]|uniref:histidine kinase n=1 Tax=Tychonema bourrellyi FEM_GT703 TaxID=2040638 RepID=A0A2G4EZ19_9CYAN|nr:hybrid sensor histidine kinase/response regulator [Tychonema bourrellyi]MDQ2098640.1 ATP-binding protein [Tychonema bourrellyi B0820]PHX54437.1 hybrid sensor histidine kinase/response regulator [Tychonema bourrellyi FEM_GT703]